MTEAWDWPSEMKKVFETFDGHEGVFIQFGDSLTLAAPNTHWTRCGTGHTTEERRFLKWTHARKNNQKNGWYLATAERLVEPPQITTFTAAIGCSAKYLLIGRRGLPPLKDLIAAYDPQLALYAIGTSDIVRKTPIDEYIQDVEKAIDLLEENGTVPIVSTLTPSRQFNNEVLKFNETLRAFAEKRNLPLLDIFAEMERRNKNIFDFLAEDGVHLTWSPPEGAPTKENLLKSGYFLRCYLTVRKGIEVKEKVFDDKENAAKSATRWTARSIPHLWKRL